MMITIRHYMTDGRCVDEDPSRLPAGLSPDQVQEYLGQAMIHPATGRLHPLILVTSPDGSRHLINTANLVRIVVGSTQPDEKTTGRHLQSVRDPEPGQPAPPELGTVQDLRATQSSWTPPPAPRWS